MNLSVDGDSDYVDTGTPDSATPVSNSTDGSDGSDLIAEHINGLLVAVPALQALLGNALTLKGSVADLATRLARSLEADGAFRKGTSFPGTPIAGQPFWRTDQALFYVYDGVAGQWVLGQDNPLYALIDGTREYTGVIKIEMSVPGVRLRGLEVSGRDVFIAESGGTLYFYDNTGTEAVPIWTERFSVNMATGAYSGAQIVGNTIPAASLVNSSLTQAQMGTGCTGTGQLKTATASSSISISNVGAGTVGNSGAITMNDYSFFPSTSVEGSGDVIAKNGTWTPTEAADAGNTTGRITVSINLETGAGGGIALTRLRWRYITASDNPDVWVVPDPLTGRIVGAWWSDDALPSGIIPISIPGLTSVRLSAADLERLAIPIARVNEARDRIRDLKLKEANIPYRALALYAADDAPAVWLIQNCKIGAGGRLTELTAQERRP
ncbi:MAG: hypothetical protein K0S79_84 [Nitrospira sp.]|jgi:hypothetical protein|nr:hypothetical protein [Nitrospira sp.]